MNTQESCRAAEEKIRQIQKTLGPQTLDQCATELAEVAALLEGMVTDGPPTESTPVRRVKQAAAALQAQVEHAANFWSGLLQMQLGTGYTDHGHPIYFGAESGSSFEG